MDLKNDSSTYIDTLKDELVDLSMYIHGNPELGNEEFLAVEAITEKLKENDFSITRPIAGLETAFKATYTHDGGGYTIGLICEYDALPELGHGCGHNLQPSAILGAALAIKEVVKDIPFTIEVFGTPAEESTSGKIPMAADGVFDHLDIAFMMHGGDRTTVDGKSLAVDNFKFEFLGKESHAAVAPEKGRSALDAAILTFNGMEYLREHVSSDVRIHGIIKNGGIAPNIVPKYASALFSIRASNRTYLDDVVKRALDVAKGSALTTGTEVKITKIKSLENKLNVQALNDVLLDNAAEMNAPNITPPRERTGSTDFSIVTHRVPGSCIRLSFVPLGVPNHTEDWVEASASPSAHEAIVYAAKIIANSSIDILYSEKLQLAIKEQFNEEKNTEKMIEGA